MLRGTSSYSAIAPRSDPANSSAVRKDKEGPIPFRQTLVFNKRQKIGLGWSFRIKGMVAHVCPTSLPFSVP